MIYGETLPQTFEDVLTYTFKVFNKSMNGRWWVARRQVSGLNENRIDTLLTDTDLSHVVQPDYAVAYHATLFMSDILLCSHFFRVVR